MISNKLKQTGSVFLLAWIGLTSGLLLSNEAFAGGDSYPLHSPHVGKGPTRMNQLLTEAGMPKGLHPAVNSALQVRGNRGNWVFTNNGPSAGLALGVSRGCIPLDAYTDAGNWDLQMLAKHRYKMYYTSLGYQAGAFLQKFWFIPFDSYSLFEMDHGLRSFGAEGLVFFKVLVGKVAITTKGVLVTIGLGAAYGANLNTMRIQLRGTGTPCFR